MLKCYFNTHCSGCPVNSSRLVHLLRRNVRITHELQQSNTVILRGCEARNSLQVQEQQKYQSKSSSTNELQGYEQAHICNLSFPESCSRSFPSLATDITTSFSACGMAFVLHQRKTPL
eukprot:GHVQ01009276.1.p1 GENE.GHVQ01009276.1~~GHVQ01009276.1.p1  ORF type:complete len:118 (+),score=8.35 GHVQ01009276.1:1928-2281(+)